MSDLTFPYSEKLIAKRFGIDRAELRQVRDSLILGSEWQKNNAGAVMLSDAGLLKLLDLTGNIAGTDLSVIDTESLKIEKNGSEPAVPKTLVVIAICPNPRMVLANESGEPEYDRELVDVGRNKNFAIGDVIQVEPHEAQHGLWQLVSKLPRTDRRPSIEGSLRDSGADWGRNAEQVLKKAKDGRPLTARDRELLRTEELLPPTRKKR